MPHIFFRHTLAFEHVAQMAATIGANDFHPFHAERMVGLADDSARDFIVERRPAAAGIELVGRAVQGRIAAPADVGTRSLVVPVFAGKRPFSAFVGNDLFFFGRQRVPVRMLHGNEF